MMRRRDFITLLGGAAAAWPLAARAQQGDRQRRIGALIGGDENDPNRQVWIGEFRRALASLRWIEGRDIRMEWRWAGADPDRATTYTSELIEAKPDVLFVDNTFVAQALQKATGSIPLVFAHITDPVASGFVVSLAHPGANITGFSDSEPESRGKLVEFLKQIAPEVTRIATLARSPRESAGRKVANAIDSAAFSLGLPNTLIEVSDASDIERGIVEFARKPNGALIVPGDPLTTAQRKLILALAASHQMPALGGNRDFAPDGGLVSYGANVIEQYRGAAKYIDRILKGEKPADLPVQAPTKYELRINLRAAKTLGLDVPPSLLALADEVIE